MRRRTWLAPVVGAVGMSAFLAARSDSANPDAVKPDLKPAVGLPISRVVLFSSGVGHFTRSADIEGDARIDLTFPEQDINDLIKSMVLRDSSKDGRISAVTYDSREPIDRTMRSFAVNLNGNPSFAQILTQMRGEKVEVALSANAAGQPNTLTGSIVGVEKQKVPAGTTNIDADVLNLWCAEGMRSVKMTDVQRLRFQNPSIENEFRRALETLTLSHDSQKKSVSVHFAGAGKRKAEVTYVIENPVWKTSYRLVLDRETKEPPFLQGWAVAENTTDEDWQNVEMALISGRPISFKMDLYNPLFVTRPTVEPELFASLRPPTYSGALGQKQDAIAFDPAATSAFGQAPMAAAAPAPMKPGFGGGRGMASDEKRKSTKELQDGMNRRMDLGASVASVATASQLGDAFQYLIDQPVSLARQKSALLPIINKPVAADRVSIYNPNVQAKHPLLGLKFKNTSGAHLAQGPITVFEGSVYAGDTRVLDLQPGEERLVSYAVDLGTEVAMKPGKNSARITKVKAVKGIVHTTTVQHNETLYDIANRSTNDRTLLIEHPNRKGEGFTFVGDTKPTEEAAEVFRFSVPVTAKKSLSYLVSEEKTIQETVRLTNDADNQIRFFLSLNETTPALKEQLKAALAKKGTWDNVRRDINTVQSRINVITQDQNRIRLNLRELPKEAEAYKTYLRKFDEQEKEMDTLHASMKTLQASENETRVALENFLATIGD